MAIKFEETKKGDVEPPAKPKAARTVEGEQEGDAATETVALPFAKPVRAEKKRKPKR